LSEGKQEHKQQKAEAIFILLLVASAMTSEFFSLVHKEQEKYV
jgi:hypothetical protein